MLWSPTCSHVEQVENSGVRGDGLRASLTQVFLTRRQAFLPGFFIFTSRWELLSDSSSVTQCRVFALPRSTVSSSTMQYLSIVWLKETVARENCKQEI